MTLLGFARGGGAKAAPKGKASNPLADVAAAIGGSGNCGTGTHQGKKGFQPGNKCAHKGNRNPDVLAKQKAHTAASAHARKLGKKHVAGTAPSREYRAAIRAARDAGAALRSAREAHAAGKKVARNAARRDARAAAKATAEAPKASTPKTPESTPKAAAPDVKAQAKATLDAAAARARADRGEPPPAMVARVEASVKEAGAIKVERASANLDAVRVGVKAGAFDKAAAEKHLDGIAKGVTKDELFAAAKAAGIEHGARTKAALVEHLKANLAPRPPEAAKPPAPKAEAPAPAPAPKELPKPPAPGPAPAPERFGKSKAEITVYDWVRDKTAAAMKSADKILGPAGTHKDVPNLIGAPDDAEVVFDHAPRKGQIEVTASSNRFTARRTIYRDKAGKLVIRNDMFKVADGQRGTGLGSEVFGRQVEQARAAGVDRIVTHAAAGEGWNGYYTWARLGYDAPLRRDFARQLPADLSGARRVSDLMRTPRGRAFWKDNGYEANMTFDLRPDSVSSRVHAAYMEERQSRPPAVAMADDAPIDPRGAAEIPDFTEEELAAADRAWDRIAAEEGTS